jgi:hypothetical protein
MTLQQALKLCLNALLVGAIAGCNTSQPLPTAKSLPTELPSASPSAAPTTLSTAASGPSATITSATGARLTATITTASVTVTTAKAATAKIATATTARPSASNANASDGRQTVDCAGLQALFTSLKPDPTAQLPANFPLPAGAQNCGVDGPGSTHFASEMPTQEVLAFFDDALAKQGCKQSARTVIRPNQINVTWDCREGLVIIGTNPQVTEFTVRIAAR